jgi:hypothetical protein
LFGQVNNKFIKNTYQWRNKNKQIRINSLIKKLRRPEIPRSQKPKEKSKNKKQKRRWKRLKSKPHLPKKSNKKPQQHRKLKPNKTHNKQLNRKK